MSRENVSYAEITCDICGATERISQSLVLPDEWQHIKIGYVEKDACPKCVVATLDFINGRRAMIEAEKGGDENENRRT